MVKVKFLFSDLIEEVVVVVAAAALEDM